MILDYTLDFWSVTHYALWFLGTFLWLDLVSDKKRLLIIGSMLFLGVWWEAAEFWLVEPWLGFYEPWYNKVTDLICDGLGVWLACSINRKIYGHVR